VQFHSVQIFELLCGSFPVLWLDRNPMHSPEIFEKHFFLPHFCVGFKF
jgi:hypothetical protein